MFVQYVDISLINSFCFKYSIRKTTVPKVGEGRGYRWVKYIPLNSSRLLRTTLLLHPFAF